MIGDKPILGELFEALIVEIVYDKLTEHELRLLVEASLKRRVSKKYFSKALRRAVDTGCAVAVDDGFILPVDDLSEKRPKEAVDV